MMNESGDTAVDFGPENGIPEIPTLEGSDTVEFGDFSSTNARDDTAVEVKGTIGSKDSGGRSDDDGDASGSDDEVELLEASKAKQQTAALWKFEYWQSFFDVDTDDVLSRLLASIDPRKNFIRAVRPKADLYGPVWICITLSFAILVSGNLSNYLYHSAQNMGKKEAEKYVWHYHFHVVSEAAVVIVSYAWLFPLLVWLFLWWRNSRAGYSLLEILSAYGYSLAVFIPISFLWIIKSLPFQWTLIALGIVLSGAVLVRTFWPAFKADSKTTAALVVFVIFAIHASVGIGFQLYFFSRVSADGVASHMDNSSVSPSTLPPGTAVNNTLTHV